jgi:acyl-CoA thioester hydrolase
VSELKFLHPIAVRFRDLDPLGHAHHTLPIVYFEEARAAYWREVAGRATLGDIDYVLAEIRLQLKQRVLYPAQLVAKAGVVHIGNASFVMAYELVAEDGAVLATAETVQVMYDYVTNRSKPMPPEVRARIEQFEGLASERTMT